MSSSSAADGFHPNKSKVSTDTMETWKNSEISGDLTQVPGIGPAAASKLAGEGITNTYQLIGKYLMMKGPDKASIRPEVHNEKFWIWLKNIGISAHRSSIVVAIGEKMSMVFPDIYDPSVYEAEEEEEEEK